MQALGPAWDCLTPGLQPAPSQAARSAEPSPSPPWVTLLEEHPHASRSVCWEGVGYTPSFLVLTSVCLSNRAADSISLSLGLLMHKMTKYLPHRAAVRIK